MRIFNFPLGFTAEQAQQTVQKTIDTDASMKLLGLTSTPAIGRSLRLRLNVSDTEKVDEITKALREVGLPISEHHHDDC